MLFFSEFPFLEGKRKYHHYLQVAFIEWLIVAKKYKAPQINNLLQQSNDSPKNLWTDTLKHGKADSV